VRKAFTTLAVLWTLAPATAWAGDHLIDLSATNLTDVLGNVSGGIQRGARLLEKADVTATFQGDDHGIGGLTIFLDGQFTDAANFSSALVGDAQGVSNIDAPAGFRLANAWVAKDFHGQGGVTGGLKAGIIDLNTEFDVQSTAALFLNSAFGIGPDFSQSGQNGPSIFPSTGLGLVGWWLPGDHWQLKAGLFQDAPGDPNHPGRTSLSFSHDEGVLAVAELRYHLTPDTVLGMGSWRYSAAFDAIDPVRGRLSNSGAYAIADALLYSAPNQGKEDDKAGLRGWVRLGLADGRINAIATTVNGGLVYTAPFGRLADQAGISFAHARFGDDARLAAGLSAAETTFEATYSFNINSHLSVQPDLQYVMSPGGDPTLQDSLVLGSRLTASW
jgi:porin